MPKIGSYPYYGYLIDEYEFKHNHFSFRFECFFNGSSFVSTLESYRDEMPVYFFHHPNKRKSLHLMKKWLSSCDRQFLFSREYKVFPQFEPILLSLREERIVYHVTAPEYAKNILIDGLIPNGNVDQDVYRASLVLDDIKPSHIPSDVIRSQSSYAYPEFSNDQIMCSERKNFVLLALKLPDVPLWIGDQGWGGICLFNEDFDEQEIKAHTKKIRKDYGKKYWKYSSSVFDFISQPHSNLDEILITGVVPPENITLIGSWDDLGRFHAHEAFENFVAPFYQSHYKDILNHYDKGN